jgi:amphi-Trp domain-containing protein
MANEEDFRHDSIQDGRSIARVLSALIEGFEKGHIDVGSGEHSVRLEPHGLLELELQAKRKNGRSKLVLKVSWRDDAHEASPDELHVGAE